MLAACRAGAADGSIGEGLLDAEVAHKKNTGRRGQRAEDLKRAECLLVFASAKD